MALYIPYSIFHLARLLYVRPETVGPYYVLYKFSGFQAIVVQITVLWFITPRRTTSLLQPFVRTGCLHLQDEQKSFGGSS